LSEWQPIETAPKDGTPVLIFVPAYTRPTLGDFPAVMQVAHWYGFAGGEFAWTEVHGEGYETYEPTHWMPLPGAPSSPSPPQSPQG